MALHFTSFSGTSISFEQLAWAATRLHNGSAGLWLGFAILRDVVDVKGVRNLMYRDADTDEWVAVGTRFDMQLEWTLKQHLNGVSA